MKDEKIILSDSPDAAELVTMQVWKTRKGKYFLNEQLARENGSTHEKCQCGEIYKKTYYNICDKCRSIEREKKLSEKYEKMPFQKWDGETPLYSEKFDQYFFDENSIECFILDHEEKITLHDLRLRICKPVKPRQIDTDYWEDIYPVPRQIDTDYWEDIYPEDMGFDEVSSERVKEAFKELNQALAEEKPWSWYPGKFRTTVNIDIKEK